MTSQKGHGADTLSYSNFDGPEASGTPDLTHHQVRWLSLEAFAICYTVHSTKGAGAAQVAKLFILVGVTAIIAAAIKLLFQGARAALGLRGCGVMQTEPAELDAQVRMIVRQEVDAAVERLRKEFAERETMLIQAFEDRAEEERNQHERPHIAIRNGEH